MTRHDRELGKHLLKIDGGRLTTSSGLYQCSWGVEILELISKQLLRLFDLHDCMTWTMPTVYQSGSGALAALHRGPLAI